MKKLTLVLVALSLTGCLHMHNEITIENDGSGFMTLELGMPQEMADAILELQELDPNYQDDMGLRPLDGFDKEQIERGIAPYDVTLTKFERFSRDGWALVSMTFDFKDLEGLAVALAVLTEEETGGGLGIFDAGDGDFVLSWASYDLGDMTIPDHEDAVLYEASSPSSQNAEIKEKKAELFEMLFDPSFELDVRWAITVPGDIIATNAPEQDDRTSIWLIDGDTPIGQADPVIVFSGKGLTIKPIGQSLQN